MAGCPTERMIADYFTKPLLGTLFTVMRDIMMGITHYLTKERVGDKVCTGMEREEINSSTTDTVNTHVGTSGDIGSATEH